MHKVPLSQDSLTLRFIEEVIGHMEALWNFEDKLKLTTQESLLLFVCTAVAIVGLCTAAALKRKAQKKQTVGQDPEANELMRAKLAKPSCNWASMKRVLMGSARWSGPNKWEERSVEDWRERPPPLLAVEGCGADVGWRSHNSDSSVWQRPILMGEKCELPRFSGLILYDESGQPIDHSLKVPSHEDNNHKEKPATVVRTTLKDLL